MEIKSGKIQKPQRVVIYGVEGIGKTTLAAAFPNPVFVDVEESSGHIDVARVDTPTSWPMLLAELDEFIKDTHGFQTLVIDSADWSEALAKKDICAAAKVTAIGDVSYGVLYQRLSVQWGMFLQKLTAIAQKMNVVLTCHAQLYKFEQPDEIGQYDRWTLKLQQSFKVDLCAMTKEWGDMVLFCNYKTFVQKTDGKNKAQGGERYMYASHHPAWDAKNRHNLAEELPMRFEEIAHCFPPSASAPTATTTAAVKEEPKREQSAPAAPNNPAAPQSKGAFNPELYNLIEFSGITEAELVDYLVAKGFLKNKEDGIGNLAEGFVKKMIEPKNWDKVVSYINDNRKQ